ncbi:hypothetical protein R3P38DRAFT_3219331 [Favolaschia claudopus]|uniref:Uncharacterized protein n=1 Tax=Favolaschia claudopus TaxID=2862362 RepID=A0AAW0A3Y5_9AGAR
MDRSSSQSSRSHYIPLVKIVLAWLVALALAVGHHAYYSSLNDHPVASGKTASLLVHSQAGASAIGIAFATVVVAMLGLSSGTAFLQCAWKVARMRAFTVSGLDAMWSSPTSLLSFFSLDFWREARGIVFIAVLAHAFQLVVTFAPGTLTVEIDVSTVSNSCAVPAFDFGSSALLYDVLQSASIPYNAPTVLAQRLVSTTLLSGQPLPPTSPCGQNCSYTVLASAPGFSCSVGTRDFAILNWTDAINGLSQFSPPPYFAAITDIMPANKNNGVFPWDTDTETQFMWDFEAQYTNYTRWNPADDGQNLTCVVYNSTYSVHYTFSGTSSSVVIDKVVPQQAATQFSSPPNDPGTGIVASSNPAIHTAWYNAIANYFAIVRSLYIFTIGSVVPIPSNSAGTWNYSTTTLELGQSQFIQPATTSLAAGNLTWHPIEQIAQMFESTLQNITLSILTGTLDNTQKTMTICTYTNTNPHFAYHKGRLWLIYGLGLGLSLLCDLFGIIALFQNRMIGGTGNNFSDFLAATRNPELNELNLKEPGRILLKYGPVTSEGGRYAFAQQDHFIDDGASDGGKESSHLSPSG